MIYKVPVCWQMGGHLVVEANDPEEAVNIAKKIAETCELPENGEYLTDSFFVDEEGVVVEVE